MPQTASTGKSRYQTCFPCVRQKDPRSNESPANALDLQVVVSLQCLAMIELQLDLNTISQLAKSNWADNWNFRAFLQQKVDPAEIDQRVHLLNAQVSAAIDCVACGNCCRALEPQLENSDIARLSRGLAIGNRAVKDKLLRRTPDKTFTFACKPCPLLKEDGRCSAYDHRPEDCRSYPHLHKYDFLSRSISAIGNYLHCPIVFNVYEQLKTSFAYDPTVDYIGDTDPEEIHGSSFRPTRR